MIAGEIGTSLAVLLGSDAALSSALAGWLEPLGWTCMTIDRPEGLEGQVGTAVPALAFVDAGGVDAGWIAAVRALSGVARGTPVLLVAGPAAAGGVGIAGRIDLPFDSVAARVVVEHWAGPLDRPAFRDPASGHYRLVRMGGRAQADKLMTGFAEHLEEALALGARGEPLQPVAHRIAGLAGMMGFDRLTPCWSALDRGEAIDPADVLAATEIALAEVRVRLGF